VSWSEAAQVGEVGAPLAPGEPRASFGLEGFRGPSVVLSAGGLGGLSTFWTRRRLEHSSLVDVLGYSVQRLMKQKIVKEETYS
jgi:hypothetical protein